MRAICPAHLIRLDLTCLMISEVVMEVNMWMVVFWLVTPCGLVYGYQCFGGTSSLIQQGTQRLNPQTHHWQ
jgi:hypothetical protein